MADTNPNAASEKDVKDVIAQLKATNSEQTAKSDPEDKTGEKSGDAKKESDENSGETNEIGKKSEVKPEAQKQDTDDLNKEESEDEAAVTAAAAKVGQDEVAKEKRGRTQRTRGRPGTRTNFRQNVKSDFSTLGESSDPTEIRKQVEFYFSDSNLPMDKFLLSKVGGSENRPVELSTIHSFKRMRRFQPFEAIVNALKDSSLLELTDNDTAVRRKTPLPRSDNPAKQKLEEQVLSRSIYAKGFGEEQPNSQFEIETFFTQFFPTNAVRLRRTPTKTFKGSVFVEFDSAESQKAFLALDPKPKWQGTVDLLIKSKKDYCEDKIRDIQAGRIQPKHQNDSNKGHNVGQNRQRGRGKPRGGRGGRGGGRGGRRNESGVPIVKTGDEIKSNGTESGQKRTHEGDTFANGTEPPAKKVDAKEAHN